MTIRLAPALSVEEWLNAAEPLALGSGPLAGKVVVLYAFQMLCPGCVQIALPQAQQVHETFDRGRVAVIGLHTVFEHHAAMTRIALQAFVHEYRLTFPIGIDRPAADGGPLPETMRAYAMQGTPTLLLIDPAGRLRKQKFGHESDLRLGAEIMSLLGERQEAATGLSAGHDPGTKMCRA